MPSSTSSLSEPVPLSETSSIFHGYHGVGGFAPLEYVKLDVTIQNDVLLNNKDKYNNNCTSLGALTDVLWRHRTDVDNACAAVAKVAPLVMLIDETAPSVVSSPPPRDVMQALWTDVLWPQAIFASCVARLVQEQERMGEMWMYASEEDQTKWKYERNQSFAAVSIATHFVAEARKRPAPPVPEMLFQGVRGVQQHVPLMDGRLEMVVVRVCNMAAFMRALHSTSELWAAFDWITHAMWSPLTLRYQSELEALLSSSPALADFLQELDRVEHRHKRIRGGFVRDVLSGDARRLGGADYFAPLDHDASVSPEDKVRTKQMSHRGDIDLFLDRHLHWYMSCSSERYRDRYYERDDDVSMFNEATGVQLLPVSSNKDRDDYFGSEDGTDGPQDSRIVAEVATVTCDGGAIDSNYGLHRGRGRGWAEYTVGSDGERNLFVSEQGKSLLAHQFAQVDHVVFALTNKSRRQRLAENKQTHEEPENEQNKTQNEKINKNEQRNETKESNDPGVLLRIAADVVLRSRSTDFSYFEHELAMCDFDVNRLVVDHRNMVHLRAFVRRICPYMEEELEHVRLLRCFETRTFGFAHRRNPKRANSPDNRLFCRWLRMVVVKGWSLDMSDADNVRCIGSLWSHLFVTVFDSDRKDLGGLLGNRSEQQRLGKPWNWAAFFPRTVSSGATVDECLLAKLTAFWNPTTGGVLARWLLSNVDVVSASFPETCGASRSSSPSSCPMHKSRNRPFASFLALTWQWWLPMASACQSQELWCAALALPARLGCVALPKGYETLSVSDQTKQLLLASNASFAQYGVWSACICSNPYSGSTTKPCHEKAASLFQWSSLNILQFMEEFQLTKEIRADIDTQTKKLTTAQAKLEELRLTFPSAPAAPVSASAEAAPYSSSFRRYGGDNGYDYNYDSDEGDYSYYSRASKKTNGVHPQIAKQEMCVHKLKNEIYRLHDRLDCMGPNLDYNRFCTYNGCTPLLPSLLDAVLFSFEKKDSPLGAWLEATGLWDVLLDDTNDVDVSALLQMPLMMGRTGLFRATWNQAVVSNKKWMVQVHMDRLTKEQKLMQDRHRSSVYELQWAHRKQMRDAKANAEKPIRASSSSFARKRARARRRCIVPDVQRRQDTESANREHEHQVEMADLDAQVAMLTEIASSKAWERLEHLEPVPLLLSRAWFDMVTSAPHTSGEMVACALDLYDATFGQGAFVRVHQSTLFPSLDPQRRYLTWTRSLCQDILQGAPRAHVADILRELQKRKCLDLDVAAQAWSRAANEYASVPHELSDLFQGQNAHAVVHACAALTELPCRGKVGLVFVIALHAPNLVAFYLERAFPNGIRPLVDHTDAQIRENNKASQLFSTITRSIVVNAGLLPRVTSIVGNVSSVSTGYFDRTKMLDEVLFMEHPDHFDQLLPLCHGNRRLLVHWLFCMVDPKHRQVPLLKSQIGRNERLFRRAFLSILCHCYGLPDVIRSMIVSWMYDISEAL